MIKTIAKFQSHAELRRRQLEEWQRLPVDELNRQAWQMVVDYRRLHDIQPHEPRLQRSVTAVRKA